jgi:TolB-like protein
MHPKPISTIGFLLVFLTLNLFSQENTKLKIAVLDFNSTGGISLEESITLTNRLRSMLVKTDALIVLERGKMEEILSEQGFQQTGCTSTECAIEVGKLLNVQKMVSGSIGKLGSTYTIDLSLIDVKTAQIEKSFVRDYKGEIDGLLRVMESVSNQIAATAKGKDDRVDQATGTITINIEPRGAEIYLDGALVGSAPLVLNNIASGEHQVRIEHKGFESLNRPVTVVDGTTTDLNLSMRPAAETASSDQNEVKEEKSGGSTWLWIGGAAVLAGGGAAFILSQNKDKGEEDLGDTPSGFPVPPGRP